MPNPCHHGRISSTLNVENEQESGLAFRDQGSGFRVQGSGFRVQGSGFRVQGSGFRVQESGWPRGRKAPMTLHRTDAAHARGPSPFRGGNLGRTRHSCTRCPWLRTLRRPPPGGTTGEDLPVEAAPSVQRRTSDQGVACLS